ncbi:4-hydroxybenzoate octaprenyltransferase [Henriciella mobilis]|uniref:4-hydroxybenzoate octaprenyltransferase n=1 Tax=Henriciella mobilis TaxID=2305467 RepID=UPI000E65F776|nr:4-hydroxybenzoate octaprenyltransferase [Henriciella mobilis]RIJ15551.1 4-hydroxybenzoate octaprenyltransferase [Henriciella mobilis]RIJ19015.1 4-hydroxybenzoate octaprenyltransferase [Henriciella mobilis]
MTETKDDSRDTDPVDADIEKKPQAPADSALPEWLVSLPEKLVPFAALARLDRPIGTWLVILPTLASFAYTRISTGFYWTDIWWQLLFAIGAIVMRGAACTWNDITDRDFDAKVERTASRPLPSGQVSLRDAYIFLGVQLLVGFLAWLCLPLDAKIVALLAIPLIGAYPFMKRITWWPQAWLGATINWGALVAAATAVHVSFGTLILFFGFAAWTIAYDTIYAIQDEEDDALIGVKSTARLMGERVILGAFSFFLIAAACFAVAAAGTGATRIGALTVIAFLVHAIWQVHTLDRDKGTALKVFRSNAWAGLILVAGFTVAAAL